MSQPSVKTRLAGHILQWERCTKCPLHHTRDKVCLYRGEVPCDVLFIGEAPGDSENAIGRPFVQSAPSGRLLTEIIEAAGDQSKFFTYAITNVIACAPFPILPEDLEFDPADINDLRDDNRRFNIDNQEIGEPEKVSIEACTPRLLEFIKLCQPKFLVTLGDPAKKHVKALVSKNRNLDGMPVLNLVHPSYIKRQGDNPLMIKRCVLQIARFVRENLK